MRNSILNLQIEKEKLNDYLVKKTEDIHHLKKESEKFEEKYKRIKNETNSNDNFKIRVIIYNF